MAILSALNRLELLDSSFNVPYRAGRELYLSIRRIIELFISMGLLIVLAPVMLTIAVLIKLDSPGPVFFVQDRVGVKRCRNGNMVRCEPTTFQFYKFRSMVQGADSALHQKYIRDFVQGRTEHSGSSLGLYKLTFDPRLTRLGRILRRTSMDELPQLINVFSGHMSLVGPRPIPCYEATLYQCSQLRRLAVRPGITGLWQVYGRSRVSFERMIQMDLEYVDRCSPVLDCKILLLTVPAVISGRGAE